MPTQIRKATRRTRRRPTILHPTAPTPRPPPTPLRRRNPAPHTLAPRRRNTISTGCCPTSRSPSRMTMTTPPTAHPAAHPAVSGPSYLLQVGSYRSSAEADQIRARLARAGIAAQVQHVVEGSRTLNRVRIGPLSDAELAKVREQLRTVNIHALVIRADR